MRNDQTCFGKTAEEVFQQNLRSEVEEVGGFVEQQQVGFVQQQRSQFDACLPAARELRNRPIQVGPL